MARFYFAFVNSTDKTFLNTFKRNDADVFSFELVHEEGQFARLEIELKNPRVGLLSPNRKQWCWLSYENEQTFSQLFFGRMVGVPQEIQNEIIKISFIAKPDDFNAQKIALAETLKTLPEYDPIWISPEERLNPDSILESRPLLWHIDRVTHQVTASNINSGEDGVINLGNNVTYDSLNINYGSPPLSKIQIEGSVSWTESVSGIFDISSEFPNPIKTITGLGLVESWPEYGSEIGGNWFIDEAEITRQDGKAFPVDLITIINTTNNRYLGFYVYKLLVKQKVKYLADRERTEIVKFTIASDIQEIFSDTGDEAIEYLTISSDEIDKPIDNETTPLVTGIKRTFFKTERGKKSIEYLIAVAKTKLLSRARAVTISGETSFQNGLSLSCRKDISLEDTRISSGAAVGKVISYSLYCDGSSNSLGCRFSIGCTIGRGNSTVVSSGTASYVDSYVNGYQFYTGKQFEALIGGITYNDFSNLPINDDGIDFGNYTKENALKYVVILNPVQVQYSYVGGQYTVQENIDRVNEYYTQAIVAMNPISNGPFETIYNLTVSDLSIPKTIDLEQ